MLHPRRRALRVGATRRGAARAAIGGGSSTSYPPSVPAGGFEGGSGMISGDPASMNGRKIEYSTRRRSPLWNNGQKNPYIGVQRKNQPAAAATRDR